MRVLNPIVSELLSQRGIEDIEEFFNPSPKLAYDPFLLQDMKEGVDRVYESIKDNRRICIYGDYDADGITSVAILMQCLSKLTDNLFYYIPSRFEEGYGLNIEAIDTIFNEGAQLILTCDLGSVAYDEVEYAKAKGMDIVVTDHHMIDDTMADCILINPKRSDCGYPFKDIAGCGVAFKFVCALQRTAGLDKSILRDVLDLVAIGTVGDVVPMIDENRTLVKYGLRELKRSKRKGLAKLLDKLNIRAADVTEENLAFSIVPVLNASGRISNADLAVKVLLSESDEKIEEYVNELIQRNIERKKYQEEAYQRCISIVEAQPKDRNFIMIKCPDIHEGIAGIVAGKIKEKYNRPVALLTPTNDGLKGTGRSVAKIDLFELMKSYQDCFDKFGGHFGACGFTMDEKHFDEVSKGLDGLVSRLLEENSDLFENEVRADMRIAADEVTIQSFNDIQLMAPFGPGNMKPVFEIYIAYISDVYYMGNDSQHVRFSAYDDYGHVIKCVLFNKANSYSDIIDNGRNVILIGTLEKKIWKETISVQLIVSEVR